MKFTESQNWTDIHAENWREIVPNPENVSTFLEIGNWEGRSTIWWSDYCVNAKIISIDPSLNLDRRQTLLGNISKHPRANRIDLRFGMSERELNRIPTESVDVVYVDGCHEAKNVLLDGLMSYRTLKQGGVLIFDDYGLEEPLGYETLKPSIGIDAFLSVIQCDVIHKGWQLAIRK